MFKIIYDTLVRPSKIATHVDEKPFRKFLEFIVVMIILAIIPVFIAQSRSLSFSNDETKAIITEINEVQPIEYEVKDGKLIFTGEGDPVVRCVKVEENNFYLTSTPVYIVFSLDGSEYEVNEEKAYIVILKENEIELRYCLEALKKSNSSGGTLMAGFSSLINEEEKVVKTISYGELNANFDITKTSELRLFNDVYNIGNLIYGKVKWGIILSNATLSISYIIGQYFSTIFITMFLMFLLFRFFGVRFRKVIKICLLCCTPYVMFNLLGYLYGAQFFVVVGEILTVYYIYRTLRMYSAISIMNQQGGNL